MNRRDFLATGSVTIASLALASTAALELTSTSGMTGSGGMSAASKLCRATFAQCLDSVFELHHTILGPVNLTLSNLLDRTATERNEQFTLIFHAPKNTELSGGTFVMAHAATGYFPLYLESAGQDDKGAMFRADFNLVTS